MSRRGYIFIIGLLVGFVISQQYYTSKLIYQHDKYVSLLSKKFDTENNRSERVLKVNTFNTIPVAQKSIENDLLAGKKQEIHNHITHIHNNTFVMDTVINLKEQSYGLEVAHREGS